MDFTPIDFHEISRDAEQMAVYFWPLIKPTTARISQGLE